MERWLQAENRLTKLKVFGSAFPEAQSRELVKGYRTDSMQFSGLVSGIEYSANGSFQQIIAQFKKDHPVTAAAIEVKQVSITEVYETHAALEKRNKVRVLGYLMGCVFG